MEKRRIMKFVGGVVVLAGICSCAGQSVVQAKTAEEIETEAIAIMDQLAAAGGRDYNLFRSFYMDDTDESIVKADYERNWSDYTERDQHFATLVAEADPYYFVDITSAINVGAYPDFSADYTDWTLFFEDTENGLKITYSQECSDRLNELFYDVIPEECGQAGVNGRNATQFNTSSYWYRNNEHVVEGPLIEMLKFAWQDEEGNLYLCFMLSNGTGANRGYSSFYVTLTDDVLGPVYEGDVYGQEVQGSFSVMNGKNQIVICKIDASEVLTGTETWGSMTYHTDAYTR